MAARKSARRSPRPSARARQKTSTRSSPARPKAAAGRGRKAARQTRRKRAATKTTRRPGARSGAAPKTASAKRRPAPRPKARAAKRPRTTAPLKKKVAARPKPKAQAAPARRPAAKPAAPARPPRSAAAARPHAARPALDRQRRILPEAEGLEREATDQGVLAAARSGGEELQHRLEEHTESSPALTAGDVDARWDDAYAVGDEAPGGDNPTPDQDRVDDIGKALGVTYDDAEELQGSNKITERDRHRWELDPASSDDWPHDKE
jgi:hypothetical protein